MAIKTCLMKQVTHRTDSSGTTLGGDNEHQRDGSLACIESPDPISDSDSTFSDDQQHDCGTLVESTVQGEVTKKSDDDQLKQISKKQAEDSRNVKLLIVLVLLMSLVGAVLIYMYTKYQENVLFEQQFTDDATKVLGSIGSSIEGALGALDSLASSITTIAGASNQTFPFITIPQFATLTAKTTISTKGLCTYLLPVIKQDQRTEWERYAARNNTHLSAWVEETLDLQDSYSKFYGPMPQNRTWKSYDTIHGDFADIPYNVSRPGQLDLYLPGWQKFPLVMTSYYPANWDWYAISDVEAMTRLLTKKKATMSAPFLIPDPDKPKVIEEAMLWCEYYKDYIPPEEECMEPLSNWFYPIVDAVDHIEISRGSDYPDNVEVKGMIAVEFYWKHYFSDILPGGSKGIIVVTENSCIENAFTYQIDGPTVIYRGVGDLHDQSYDSMAIKAVMSGLNSFRAGDSEYTGLPLDDEKCFYSFTVYPSDEMKSTFETSNGIIFAVAAVAFIIIPVLIFLIYDKTVARRQEMIITSAQQSNELISSLYPAAVRDKLFALENKNVLSQDAGLDDDPIAELYPETTILFLDLVSFTAWSSVRDPYQVFILLETVYGAFDKVAERRRVFKVETIGDSYLAVAGVPERRRDHVVVMAKFASEILMELRRVTSELSTRLGPGTASLNARVGLNSGPTTAGVLRGAKGRFQLFGDTLNTAARMEANSLPGKIMCSEKTKDLLIAAGKEHWVTKRDDLVEAKGKGAMVCYWVRPKNRAGSITTRSVTLEDHITKYDPSSGIDEVSKDLVRQVDWMTEMFEGLLNKVISNGGKCRFVDESTELSAADYFGAPRDEVSETIILPKVFGNQKDIPVPRSMTIDTEVKAQLREYISRIASMYKSNHFHNFDHACHVVLASNKLLSRVIKPSDVSASSTSYGITSDPLTQFAIVFSALIHDVDHPGVSNAQLIAEGAEIARVYENKSVAEQNSITISWDLLMTSNFDALRNAIMPTESDRRRFRQIVVNSVMATDLFDKDLKQLRESRWSKAFASSETVTEGRINRLATIVIEHVIQAADVSHTMQHWHVYQKWNRLLFLELYTAYSAGRLEKDPSIGWYDGELWFFDNYIIPLAKKLKTCGVFGVSCDELLDYATDNRAEWAAKGQRIVAQNVLEAKESQCAKLASNLCDILSNVNKPI